MRKKRGGSEFGWRLLPAIRRKRENSSLSAPTPLSLFVPDPAEVQRKTEGWLFDFLPHPYHQGPLAGHACAMSVENSVFSGG
jgi:hypothetical protein